MAAGFEMIACATSGIEAVRADSARQFDRHSHDQFGIGVIDRGAQHSSSGRGPVEAGPGDAITVNPGEVHDGAPIGDDGRRWRMLYFAPPLIEAAAQDIFPSRSGGFALTRPVIGDRRVAGLLRHLFAAETGAADPLAREQALVRLLAVSGGIVPADAASASPEVGRARQRIEDDPGNPVSLSELAEVAGMSRFQLLRAFKQESGLTPHAYLVQRRVDLARRLIRSGAGLAEAAVAAGFADQSHMTRIFVRRYGLTPGAYARALR